MSQEKINLRLRMSRRLSESTSGIIQCERCGERFSPKIRIGTNRMPNDWFVCSKCKYGEDI